MPARSKCLLVHCFSHQHFLRLDSGLYAFGEVAGQFFHIAMQIILFQDAFPSTVGETLAQSRAVN